MFAEFAKNRRPVADEPTPRVNPVVDALVSVVCPETFNVEYRFVAPETPRVEDAKSPPLAFTENKFVPLES